MQVLICDRCREIVDNDNPAIGRPLVVSIRQKGSGRVKHQDLCRSCQAGLQAWWDRGPKTKTKTNDEENESNA